MKSVLFLVAGTCIACATTDTGGDGSVPVDSTATEASLDVSVDAPVDVPIDAAHVLDVLDVSPRDSVADTGADALPSDTHAADTGSSRCGTCPSGFTCGASGYCVTADGVPSFGHVYLVMMENHSLSTLMTDPAATYISMLMSTYVYATGYVTRLSSPIHPSCPNYIALTSGDTHGIQCDCAPATPSLDAEYSCLLEPTHDSCPQTASHMGDLLDTAGVQWRAYGEDMGTPCNLTESGNYVTRHIPFLYYTDVQNDAARCAMRVRDLGDFAGDLAAGTYRFSMISPNLCDDMHGNGLDGLLDTCTPSDTGAGDHWMSTFVPTLLATPGFGASGTDVLFIVWDEEDGSTGSAPIPLIVVSPLVAAGTTTPTAYDHYSLLATILEGLGLGSTRVGSAEAMSATPIHDVWR